MGRREDRARRQERGMKTIREMIVCGSIDEPAFYAALPGFVELDPEQRREEIRKVKALLFLLGGRYPAGWMRFWWKAFQLLQALAEFQDPEAARFAAEHVLKRFEAWQGREDES